jgi:protein SCO1/2
MQTTISGTIRDAMRRIIPLLCVTALLGACSPPQPPQLNHATLLPSAKPLLDFTLVDQNHQPFTQASFLDHWTFAFFGYTHCPDVCPTALTMLVQLRRKLEASMPPDKLPAVVFFSVDPERDTPEQLAKFVPYFHPEFLGVTGDIEQIMTLTRQIGILHARAENASDDNYLVDHSAAIVLFDPAGKFHAVFGVPHDPDLIATDFLAIRQYYEATR